MCLHTFYYKKLHSCTRPSTSESQHMELITLYFNLNNMSFLNFVTFGAQSMSSVTLTTGVQTLLFLNSSLRFISSPREMEEKLWGWKNIFSCFIKSSLMTPKATSRQATVSPWHTEGRSNSLGMLWQGTLTNASINSF